MTARGKAGRRFLLYTQIAADASVDLHMHTIYSDGRWSAEQLLDHLAQEQFALVAATDHDRVETVHRSGGVALIAHPGRGLREPQEFTLYTPDLLDQVCAELPLDGIEVYYPTHTPDRVETYLAYANQHDLLISAGSDSHGPPGRMPIKYQARLCQRLFERVGIAVQ